MESAAWGERLYNKDAGQMIDSGWNTGSPEPDLVLRMQFHSTTHRIDFVEDPEIDVVLDAERGATDLAKRKEILQTQTLPKLMDKIPSYPFIISTFITGYRDNVKGFTVWPSAFYFPETIYKV
jgi:ABC-type dipeptide transport system, periplasmic component